MGGGIEGGILEAYEVKGAIFPVLTLAEACKERSFQRVHSYALMEPRLSSPLSCGCGLVVQFLDVFA